MGDTGVGDAASTVAVLAVKRLDEAKSRLAASRGADPAGRWSTDPTHQELVLAMMLDTIAALVAAGVDRVVVVSPDETVLAAARAAGAFGLAEQPGGAGLNVAFGDGIDAARRRWPRAHRILLVQADLPAADPASIGEALAEATGHAQAVVSDREGSGTVLLIRSAAEQTPPRFGPGSASAHIRGGAVELDPTHARWADLRTDVDTADDLEAATELGLGSHTAAVLAKSVVPCAATGRGDRP